MPSSVEAVCVDTSRVAEMWPHVVPLLRPALERTGLGLFADLEREVLHGNILLWVAWDGLAITAAATTALYKTECGLVCTLLACGGSAQDWLPLVGTIEKYAKDEGCKRTRIIGRKGWLGVLDGYRERHLIMDKEIV